MLQGNRPDPLPPPPPPRTMADIMKTILEKRPWKMPPGGDSSSACSQETSAQAGPLRAAAIRHGTLHAAPALPQAGNQERRRSMARTWGGVGLIGAGIVTAFYSQECGTMGSLGPPATASDGLLTAAFSARSRAVA